MREVDELIEKLNTTHTISIRKICQDLKAARQWVHHYVLPYISEDRIDISNGMKGGNVINANYLELLSRRLSGIRGYEVKLKDLNWYSKERYEQFLEQHVRVSRQTKRIPVEILLEPSHIERFHLEYQILNQQMQELYDSLWNRSAFEDGIITAYSSIKAKRDLLYKACLSEQGKQIAFEPCRLLKRSEVSRTLVDVPVVPCLDSWIAPHDARGYGDTDEMIFRRFFTQGHLRIELNVESVEGKIGQKVYYMPDPDPILFAGSVQSLTVSYQAFSKYYLPSI